MVATLFKTKNALPAKTRVDVIALLNQHLADTTDLFTQVKTAHWNVEGPQFIALHELFDKLAEQLLEHTDLIAERGTALGGLAAGTVRQAATSSRLKDLGSATTDGLELVGSLVDRYAQLAAATREAIGRSTELEDADTADLFTQVSRDLDMSLWFLEAHLQSRGR